MVITDITPQSIASQAVRIEIGDVIFNIANNPNGDYASCMISILDSDNNIIKSVAATFTKTQLINGLNAGGAAIITAIKNKLGLS